MCQVDLRYDILHVVHYRQQLLNINTQHRQTNYLKKEDAIHTRMILIHYCCRKSKIKMGICFRHNYCAQSWITKIWTSWVYSCIILPLVNCTCYYDRSQVQIVETININRSWLDTPNTKLEMLDIDRYAVETGRKQSRTAATCNTAVTIQQHSTINRHSRANTVAGRG